MQCRNIHRQAAAVEMSAELEVKARLGLKHQVWTSTHFIMAFPISLVSWRLMQSILALFQTYHYNKLFNF